MRRLMNGAALLALGLLAGCDAPQRLGSAEDRINAAVPLSAELRIARDRLGEMVADTHKAEQPAFEAAWSSRMRARASSCSPDYTPNWRHSAEEVRAAVRNLGCFAEFDNKLMRWVGAQRVRHLLAMPAITIGTVPPSITLQGEQARFSRPSARGPVAAVTTTHGIELIALDGGRRLYGERSPESTLDVSPNGRIFAQRTAGAVRLRSTEGGETLLELPDAAGVHWLGSWFLGVRSGSNKAPYVLSLRSALEAPLVTTGSPSTQAFLPGPPGGNRFNLVNFLGLQQYEVAERDGALNLTLVAEQAGPDPRLMHAASQPGQLSDDGKEWVLASGDKLVRLDLETLQLRETSFAPARVSSAAPTPTSQQFVVALSMQGGPDGISAQSGNYLFDARKDTVARVQGPAAQREVRYFPGIRRLVHGSPPAWWLSEQLETAAPMPLSELLANMLEESNQHKLSIAAAEDQRVAASPALQPGSPLLAAVQGASVEGVGIYEAREKIARPGESRSTGRVVVTVRRSARPLVLVLCSYEPVQWHLKLEPGARLSAVLVGGYHDSVVLGAGDARVLKIGRIYAYQQQGAEFITLQREVARWAGRPISLFQSAYAGTSYTVGGP